MGVREYHNVAPVFANLVTCDEKDDENVEKACARPTMAVRVDSEADVGKNARIFSCSCMVPSITLHAYFRLVSVLHGLEVPVPLYEPFSSQKLSDRSVETIIMQPQGSAER